MFDFRLAMRASPKLPWRTGNPPKGYRVVNRLNRSRNWSPATSYSHARSLSPYPGRPVR